MARTMVSAPPAPEASGAKEPARVRTAESGATIVFGLWMLTGLFLDGWAHSNQKPDSFFTPWHAVLYSGFTGAAIVAVWVVWRRRQPGQSWASAVPVGHGYSLVGIGLFAIGAFGDLAWHQAFGVEASTEALLSPTHLFLMIGGVLALTGPVRAATAADPAPTTLRQLASPLLAVGLVASLAAFFTLYASPFGSDVARFASVRTDIHDFSVATPEAFAQLRERWLLTSILFSTVLLIAPVLYVTRRWRLPSGSLTLLLGLLAVAEAALGDFERPLLAVGVLAAGILGDWLVQRRVPEPVLAGAIAAVVWVGYFAGVQAHYGVGWVAALWTGAIVLGTIEAVALSLLRVDVHKPVVAT